MGNMEAADVVQRFEEQGQANRDQDAAVVSNTQDGNRGKEISEEAHYHLQTISA